MLRSGRLISRFAHRLSAPSSASSVHTTLRNTFTPHPIDPFSSSSRTSTTETSLRLLCTSSSSSTTPPPAPTRTYTTDEVYTNASNRATRYVYLRTLPLQQQPQLSTYDKSDLGRSIEDLTYSLCSKHVDEVMDERSAIHLHTACLALSTYRVLHPLLRDECRVLNMIRRAFGAPLAVEAGMSEEEKLTLNDDLVYRPDYWVIKTALWFAPNKLTAVNRMVSNFRADFGDAFDVDVQQNVQVAGLQQTLLIVNKCLYQRVCQKEGLTQVTQIFCALEKLTFAPINLTRHKIRFTLDRTLADEDKDDDSNGGMGADEKKCEFKFVNIK